MSVILLQAVMTLQGHREEEHCAMRYGSTAKVLANCKLEYHGILLPGAICTWTCGSAAVRPGQIAVLTMLQGRCARTRNAGDHRHQHEDHDTRGAAAMRAGQ